MVGGLRWASDDHDERNAGEINRDIQGPFTRKNIRNSLVVTLTYQLIYGSLPQYSDSGRQV